MKVLQVPTPRKQRLQRITSCVSSDAEGHGAGGGEPEQLPDSDFWLCLKVRVILSFFRKWEQKAWRFYLQKLALEYILIDSPL
ncbi:hypothetical protein J5N97_008505 [Dioscorea zingiberensis]|uniref:Uncharacterized protein n=1 Tax=Dioscorea zingiberensis TaxID=325984 RepID=A0A9D5HKR2_9LILI|nr:hypothetical protein J5N97_008505 [Dioscorea zingiberensis]